MRAQNVRRIFGPSRCQPRPRGEGSVACGVGLRVGFIKGDVDQKVNFVKTAFSPILNHKQKTN